MTAKEFYENQLHDNTTVVGRLEKDEIIELMQAYHEAKMKEITDADIEAWVSKQFLHGESALKGAKAFRDGVIVSSNRDGSDDTKN